MKSTIPPALRQAICENNLIIFVGAGLSCTLLNTKKQALGGWSNLVKQMLLRLQETGYDVTALLALIEENYDPIDILHLIEKKKEIPKAEVGSFIKEFLDIDEKNDFTLHTKIYALSRKIITTNYDTAFEQAVQELRKSKAYKGKNYELTKHKDANASLLFKLHGCFEDVGSMVLFPSSYTALYDNPNKDAEHSLLVLQNIIVNKTILFIGSGMGDFQINNIFRAIHELQGTYNQQHFIITKTAVDSSLTFLTPVPIEDYADIGGILDDLLAIKEKCSKAESEEITRLRTELEETQKQRTELQEKIEKLQAEGNPAQKELLQREALEHFERGLQHNLSGALEAAAEEYERVTELLPASHEAWCNWGNALADLAKTKEDAQADMLYKQAYDKYQQAIDIKHDFHEAFYNWGNTLSDLAKTKQGGQAEELFRLAFEKYQQATTIKHDDHVAFNNWGVASADLAKTKEGKEANTLFLQAYDKYQQAIDIKHDFHEAFNNWGSALVNLAKKEQGEQDDNLFQQAIEKYEQAIARGGSSYNLACLYALTGKRALALQHLQHSLSRNEIYWQQVLQDDDWKDYFDDPKFKTLIEQFKT